MQNRDTFSGYHPAINFLYFGLVLLFSMCFMHPASRAISLCCSLAYSINLNGGKAVRFSLRYLLPMMAVAMLVDPAFNHEGATILAYLPSGNPLTLESIVYGLSAAAMMASVILWFSCYNAVMTSDKFVYLFGRVIPALSLVLSMALRFAPKFKAQLHTVSEAQRCVGRDDHAGLQCPVCTGAVDTVADVLYGHHRFPCGGIVSERLAAPQQGVLCAFGVFAAIVIYGGIMNPASALMWSDELNTRVILTYYLCGFPMDCIHAAASALFCGLAQNQCWKSSTGSKSNMDLWSPDSRPHGNGWKEKYCTAERRSEPFPIQLTQNRRK